ncbi:unnamed protein product [Linum trigynum]|uniref:Uncharacterized protein n=1 Tax=Linum trigynum TaxID=586398 RepID=A0AAV2GMY6_9ROSI
MCTFGPESGDNKLVLDLKELKENQHRGANQLQNQNEEAGAVEEPRTMGYYMAPRAADIQSPILHPPLAANNFEIKPSFVMMIQNNALFHGLANESPREHVQRFLEVVGSLKIKVFPSRHCN